MAVGDKEPLHVWRNRTDRFPVLGHGLATCLRVRLRDPLFFGSDWVAYAVRLALFEGVGDA